MEQRFPQSAEEVSAILSEASSARRPIFVRGNGTKAGWNQPSSRRSATLQPGDDEGTALVTSRLNRLIAHRFGDLTATVEAGAVLDDVNRELARHGQWIPLDPNWPDRATIGGIVSANDSGPRRHRFGGPRDLIIGIEIARADGVRAKAGGIVVKNVAGYDLARLMTGSFGCLAVILTVTFKLYPLPAASRTVIVDVPDASVARALVRAIDRTQLTPTAVEIQLPPMRLLIRFESTASSIETQCSRAVALAAECGGHANLVDGAEEEALWSEHRRRPWAGDGAVVKVTLLPSELSNVIDAIARTAGAANVAIAGRAGLGVLTVGLNGDAGQARDTIRALRTRPVGTGSATLLRASDELKEAVGVWGPQGDAFRIMQGLKRAFDPNGTLNPGGGPHGI
ncbi:MAG TPA: FAD-binding oxidoreductase [Vicinamibacterales bacterium]